MFGPLRDIGNAATLASIQCSTGQAHGCNDAGTAGYDQRLMDDDLRIGAAGSVVTIQNIIAQGYWVYTYAWGPCAAADLTNVTIGGAVDTCGGAWNAAMGIFNPGVTYVCHAVTVTDLGGGFGTLTIQLTRAAGARAHLNGIQITPAGVGPGPTVNPG